MPIKSKPKNSVSPIIISDDHKLCGYLITALTTTDEITTLPLLTPLTLFSTGGPHISFKPPSPGPTTTLSPLPPRPISNSTPTLKPKQPPPSNKKANNKTNKAKLKTQNNNNLNLNNGNNGSVVQQVKTLVNQKCISIVARVVGFVVSGEGEIEREREVRVVVLIDVYLPSGVWEFGWQFPKSSSTAASLFRHLSCNWEERATIVKEGYLASVKGDDKSLWNIADCHVIGCKQHSVVSNSANKKGFGLDEIFENLPRLTREMPPVLTSILPGDSATYPGVWDLTDDILVNILSSLHPVDLVRVSAACRHMRHLSTSIMPCIKLKLFPHQQAAVEWMLQREMKGASLQHPLYVDFVTEDGFAFYINIVSGELVTGSAPIVSDFRGGMFCDEPGLGKTVTALSLILKTQGTLADPPEGAEVIWCADGRDEKCGYYECTGNRYSGAVVPSLGQVPQIDRRSQFSADELIPKDHFTPKRARLLSPSELETSSMYSCPETLGMPSTGSSVSVPAKSGGRSTRNLTRVKKNLLDSYGSTSATGRNSGKRKRASSNVPSVLSDEHFGNSSSFSNKRQKKDYGNDIFVYNETWAQCDACRKWRRLSDDSLADSTAAWFCSLNADPLYNNCSAPEESFDHREPLTYLPGFCSKETPGGLPQNVAFFISVLKENYAFINCHTRKALAWLATLSPLKLSEMETVGLVRPGQLSTKEANGFHKIYQAFGLVKRVEQGLCRWFYPKSIKNLDFDLPALRTALCEPLDSFRMYLSRATLIVVPANLVDHWITQIEKHVKSQQLRVYVWADHKKPSAHNLAWDYDVVITTFSRLSAEWSPQKRSALMQVHWMRIMLDEGHTLGSSVSLTNKVQMAVSLSASNRWILTGTPTPNTPNTQVAQIQPMLKFLHDEAYGENHKNWEAGVLKPFEAELEEGRLRLLQLLKRCMISARKSDLHCIPPCIKKTTCINFTKQHAKTYNELVVTVRRNILLADWNDPSHVESLLNPKQWKFRSSTIRNVRLSCCVAGHIKVSDAGQDIQETMEVLVQNGLDVMSEEHALIKYHLSYGGDCRRCQEWCRLPIITPCRHLLCLDCVALDSEKCALPGCGHPYEMQSPQIRSRPENPNPKWPVPKDLIELQPSYKQENWDPDWQLTSSSKVTYLVQRLKEIQNGSKKSDCSRNERNLGWKPCDFVCNQEGCMKLKCDSSETPSEKVLVFSQFLEHIYVIEQQLAVNGIKFAGMHSPLNAISKKKSLATFQHDPSCMVLVMDGTAALGLDLSFVSHVFLMEPIWDRSMEEQVISRAHRMGAMRPIHVETLAMRGTIEDQMLEFLQNTNECRRLLKEDHENFEHEGGRAQRSLHDFAERNYLTRLSMVRTQA